MGILGIATLRFTLILLQGSARAWVVYSPSGHAWLSVPAGNDTAWPDWARDIAAWAGTGDPPGPAPPS